MRQAHQKEHFNFNTFLNVLLLYAIISIEEERLDYNTVIRTFESLLTLEG